MFLAEPPPSPADLHFRVFGFPVRVHPFFWVVSVFFGISGENRDPLVALSWVGVVFISIVIHELGHAFLQRKFGGRPRIVLYSFGGLAISDDCDPAPRSQIAISLAGPFAGFAFAAIIALAIRASGHLVGFGAEEKLPQGLNLDGFWMLFGWLYFESFESSQLNELIRMLFWVNIWWGIINLLPVYPLDGGRVSRELCTLHGDPRQGIVNSLWISIFTAAAVAGFTLYQGQRFTPILFGLLAWSNYQALQNYRGRGYHQGW